MSDELLKYYNRELAYLRHMGAEFAERYPKVAGRLRMSEDNVEDPHVSRLLEGVSLLTAQVRQKLDDSFPELTEALLGQLYPDYHAPIPSMSVIKMSTQNVTDYSLMIPKGTELETQVPGYKNCRFNTCYDTQMWPVEVTQAKFEGAPFKAPRPNFQKNASAVIKLRLSCEFDEVAFSDLGVDKLRFYIHGQSQLSYQLYQLIFQSSVGMAFAAPGSLTATQYLQARHISAVGFGDDEKVVPYDQRTFNGYRLLVEHFLCPEKFMFFELQDLDPSWFGEQHEVDLYIYLDSDSDILAKQLTADNIMLGCVPVINLFEDELEPLRLDPARFEHRLVPRYRDADISEVVRVTEVEAFDQHDNSVDVTPFYGSQLPHYPQAGNLFWTLRRELNKWAGGHDEPGVESYLAVVDGNAKPLDIDEHDQWLVSAKALCSNRNLPARLPFGGGQPSILVPSRADSLKNVRCLLPFSEPIRPAMFDASRWQLASHLTLNHFSQPNAVKLLQELLQLYDFKQSPQTKVLIEAIAKVNIERATARVVQNGRVGFCHGSDIILEFVNQDLSGINLFFFGNVLAHFFAQYTTINSFTRLSIKLLGDSNVLHRWPAMAGDKELI
ncbi:type VI secretion system protein ImpG [Agarivorans sp. Toyoura001]|uniref:type VI secretion system baseplate subunit TssF n=1 Tax=Agarivorans sp. Toyoura001 TaxID=2283141 RepID=UPI0010E5B88D|nr:type VI secretion system baseplate subunit TssF [Agarivorans sp. Toyoura001]GDY25305.1 type VI secretion system protein ImpG [Agarivorans sp. Toyoura001]